MIEFIIFRRFSTDNGFPSYPVVILICRLAFGSVTTSPSLPTSVAIGSCLRVASRTGLCLANRLKFYISTASTSTHSTQGVVALPAAAHLSILVVITDTVERALAEQKRLIVWRLPSSRVMPLRMHTISSVRGALKIFAFVVDSLILVVMRKQIHILI